MSQNRLPGIANSQNTKRLGHFLTTDCKSVETPNGILSPSCVKSHNLRSRPGGFEIRRKKTQKRVGHFLTTDCKSVETPNGKNELYCG